MSLPQNIKTLLISVPSGKNFNFLGVKSMCKDLRDNESSKKMSAASNKDSAKESSSEKETNSTHKDCGCGGY